jgi:hypothetical protein
VTFRLDPAIYGALAARCSAHQISMNSLVNQALALYLSVPLPQDPHLSYQNAIRKLSGGPDSTIPTEV